MFLLKFKFPWFGLLISVEVLLPSLMCYGGKLCKSRDLDCNLSVDELKLKLS